MLRHERQAGLYGGTFAGMLPLITGAEFLHTAILAFTGAVVSFTVSYFMKRMLRQAQHDGAGGDGVRE